jgi:hypothetical protein
MRSPWFWPLISLGLLLGAVLVGTVLALIFS